MNNGIIETSKLQNSGICERNVHSVKSLRLCIIAVASSPLKSMACQQSFCEQSTAPKHDTHLTFCQEKRRYENLNRISLPNNFLTFFFAISVLQT